MVNYIQTFQGPQSADTQSWVSYDIVVERFDPETSKNFEVLRTVKNVMLPYDLILSGDSSYYSTLFAYDASGLRFPLYSLAFVSPSGKENNLSMIVGVFVQLVISGVLVCPANNTAYCVAK